MQNVWGNKVSTNISTQYDNLIIQKHVSVSLEDAIFRDVKAFKIGNLLPFIHFGKSNFKESPKQTYYLGLDTRSAARRISKLFNSFIS